MRRQPQKLPDADIERAIDFIGHATQVTTSKTAIRIVKDIAEDTLRFGNCGVSHNEFSRRTGKCRRTVDTTMKRVQTLGLITKTGRTEEGRSIYKAVWEAANG